MKKNSVLLTVIIAVFIISFSSANGAEPTSDFTMVGTWTAEYKSQKIIITFQDDHKGLLSIDGTEPIKILKWEENIEKNGKINIGLYFLSRDKDRFAKRTLRMYNSGRGFKLKAIYQTEDKLNVYNALSIQDGKVEKDDGRMELQRENQ